MSPDPERTPRTPDPADPIASRSAEFPRPERVCPTCGSVLIERKCKLICPDPACGYYMSCADFY